MKLPGGKKERMQIMIAALLFGAIGVGLIVFFVVFPEIDKQKKALEEIKSLEGKLEDGQEKLRKALHAEAKKEEAKAKLREIDSSHMLKAHHDNYFIDAENYVRDLAKRAKVKINPRRVGTMTALPKGAGHMADAYVMTLEGISDYEGIIRLFETIHEDNPYAMTSKFKMFVTGKDMEQSFKFNLWIPRWIKENTYKSFKASETST